MAIVLSLLLIASNPPAGDEVASFVAGIERSPLLLASGQALPRVEKLEGRVIALRLDGMQLSADDFRLLGSLTTVRRMSLYRTNVTDKDLAQLRGLTSLEGLVLSNTEVTDEALGTLVALPALRSLCLGNVRITPAAVGQLKEKFPHLSLGYAQRPQ